MSKGALECHNDPTFVIEVCCLLCQTLWINQGKLLWLILYCLKMLLYQRWILLRRQLCYVIFGNQTDWGSNYVPFQGMSTIFCAQFFRVFLRERSKGILINSLKIHLGTLIYGLELYLPILDYLELVLIEWTC